MNLKIITIVSASLLSVCIGEAVQDAHQQHPKHAISSISYHREDVPLSYKYSAIHTYTTSKPTEEHKHANYYQKSGEPIHLRSIQYAPLIKPGELRFQNAMYTKKSLHSPHNLLNDGVSANEAATAQRDRKPLEPKVEPNSPVAHPHHLVSHLEYTPGHNVEVLRSINRSPGHNAVYRSNPEGNPPIDKQKKTNYLNQYIIYQPHDANPNPHEAWQTTAEFPHTTTTITTSTTPKSARYPHAPNSYAYGPKSNVNYHIIEVPVGLKQQLPKTSYTKMHALLLNVARAYNMALSPHKSLHTGASPVMLENIPPLSQSSYLNPPGTLKLQTSHDPKTIMYPVQKNVHFAIHS